MNSASAIALDLLAAGFPRYVDRTISSVNRLLVEQKDLPKAISALFLKKIEEQEQAWNQKFTNMLTVETQRIDQLHLDEGTAAYLILDLEHKFLYTECEERFHFKPVHRGLFLKVDDTTFTPHRWLEWIVRGEELEPDQMSELRSIILAGGHLQFTVEQTKFARFSTALTIAKKMATTIFQQNQNAQNQEVQSQDERLLLIMNTFISLCHTLAEIRSALQTISNESSYTVTSDQEPDLKKLLQDHATVAQLSRKYPNFELGPLLIQKDKRPSGIRLSTVANYSQKLLANFKKVSHHIHDLTNLFTAYLHLDTNSLAEDPTLTTLRKIERVFSPFLNHSI